MPSLPDRLYDFCTVNFSKPKLGFADRELPMTFKASLEITPILVPLQRKDQMNSRMQLHCDGTKNPDLCCLRSMAACGNKVNSLGVEEGIRPAKFR
jgi:hypothetical protein